MDKREFLAVATAAVLANATRASTLPPDVSGTSEGDLQISPQTQSVLDQLEVIALATATTRNRFAFISDPIGFGKAHGIDLDPGFAALMVQQLHVVGAQARQLLAKVSGNTDTQKDGDGTAPAALPLVVAAVVTTTTTTTTSAAAASALVAAAQVVAAVAAVVSAAAAVYAITKFQLEEY